MQDALKGKIPEHFDVFNSKTSQQHGYDTQNGERNKTYQNAINDWASLPSELKRLMPKTTFNYKLKQLLLNHSSYFYVSFTRFLNMN